MKLRPTDTPEDFESASAETPPAHVLPTLPIKSRLKVVGHMRPFHMTGNHIPHAFALLEFENRNGETQRCMIPASLLLDAKGFQKYLADRFFDWSTVANVAVELDALRRPGPPTDGIFTFVPGWHGDAYNRGGKWFRAAGDQRVIHYQPVETVKAPAFIARGKLQVWQRKVARMARHSSRIRLALAMPFGATVMRLLPQVSPFGVIFVGRSSIGKTLLLVLIGSVLGCVGDGGLPNLGSSLKAIEEMRLGSRDSVTLLDELGQVLGDPKRVAEFVKALAFMAGTSRPSDRSGAWEKATNAAKVDCPTILAITSETSAGEVCEQAMAKQLRGQAVRLIDLIAAAEGSVDIFDGSKADAKIGKNVQARRETVDKLMRSCREHQGVPHEAFLEALCSDGLDEARRKLKEAMTDFYQASGDLAAASSVARIGTSFALLYAAACLAIDYRILPWGRAATLRDILKCYSDAVRELDQGVTTSLPKPSDDELLEMFKRRLKAARRVNTSKGVKGDEKHQAAVAACDVVVLDRGKPDAQLLIKPTWMQQTFNDLRERKAILDLLKRREVMLAGRDKSTNTRQVQLAAIGPKKQPYFVLRAKALGKVPGDAA